MLSIDFGTSFITHPKYDGRLNGIDAMRMQEAEDKKKGSCVWRATWGGSYEVGCLSTWKPKTSLVICPYCGKRIEWREF